MQLLKTLEWQDPLNIAANISADEGSWVLLYSGMQASYTGRYSFLAFNKQEEVTGGFAELEKKLTSNEEKFSNSWFGYFGYGLKNELEKLSHDEPSAINPSDLWFARYGIILVFDHEQGVVEVWGEDSGEGKRERGKGYLDALNNIFTQTQNNADDKTPPSPFSLFPSPLSSNMTRAQYLEKVSYIKEAIARGDIYQANLTRKFFGKIENAKPFDIFTKLCSVSPAPYSAFMKRGDLHIISSSPERFLKIDKNGNVNTRPIKGSAARNADKEKDAAAIEALAASEKDRAENLMIVDLSRNDLARNCNAGSIKVEELFNIETYATVHHMVSSVSGVKKPEASTLDLIKGCFPPGSMTGTPKIKAMQICSELEGLKRGIYSGALGWLGGDGSTDLAVVIRTIILQGNKFEFQVGGAIVNDSTPEAEFAETMTKAKGVAAALGISISELEGL